MNVSIARKTFRDSRWLLVLIPVAIVCFEALIVRALGELPIEMRAFWLNQPFVSRLVRMLLGADLGSGITPTTLVTIGLAHPLLYALTWTLLLTVCTRTTVGEIDRGTADLLLTLPVSRACIYASASLVWILAAAVVSVAPFCGLWIGQWLHPLWEPIDFTRLRTLVLNLFALHLSVGCMTMLVSSLVSRRGTAIAVVLSGLLLSFLLNFLATLWPAAERVAFLGPLHYYKPLLCIREGGVRMEDLAVLGAVSAASWLAGLRFFCRRDIPAP